MAQQYIALAFLMFVGAGAVMVGKMPPPMGGSDLVVTGWAMIIIGAVGKGLIFWTEFRIQREMRRIQRACRYYQ